jgi:hypothetical protein
MRSFQSAIGSRGCGVLDAYSQFFSALDSTLNETGRDVPQVAAGSGRVLDRDFGSLTDRSERLRFAATQSACHGGFGGKNSFFYFLNCAGVFCRHVCSLSVWIDKARYVSPGHAKFRAAGPASDQMGFPQRKAERGILMRHVF